MSQTEAIRWVFCGLFVLAILGTLVAWMGFDKDPSAIVPVLGVLLGAVTAGELSNVGKRATYKPEAK